MAEEAAEVLSRWARTPWAGASGVSARTRRRAACRPRTPASRTRRAPPRRRPDPPARRGAGAANIPSGTPSPTARMVAGTTSWRVRGRRFARSTATDRSSISEVPRSPRQEPAEPRSRTGPGGGGQARVERARGGSARVRPGRRHRPGSGARDPRAGGGSRRRGRWRRQRAGPGRARAVGGGTSTRDARRGPGLVTPFRNERLAAMRPSRSASTSQPYDLEARAPVGRPAGDPLHHGHIRMDVVPDLVPADVGDPREHAPEELADGALARPPASPRSPCRTTPRTRRRPSSWRGSRPCRGRSTRC